jgi:hypothetical protein
MWKTTDVMRYVWHNTISRRVCFVCVLCGALNQYQIRALLLHLQPMTYCAYLVLICRVGYVGRFSSYLNKRTADW